MWLSVKFWRGCDDGSLTARVSNFFLRCYTRVLGIGGAP